MIASLSRILRFFVGVILVCCFAAHPACAQCSDWHINQAYQNVYHRPPDPAAPMNGMRSNQITSTSGECNPNIYGGGSYGGNLNKLAVWVMAAHVCQDPWIAEVYATELSGGAHLLNAHFPTQLENGRPFSTAGQCNRTNYGSWRNFQELAMNVTKYLTSKSRM